ncbi:FtsX-like permease family protein [Algiphilus sp. NNCM1]|uniref:ABC transporter permease n=1 Tax=Algiphilus sp. TaxID=1872431 RepID=UPI001CA640DE|nr:FtsX-like permease family protein [Algiphilus sp.]MBY8964110.1 FtsX-like permease family protein [Algiphilus acroporae]MCI5104605.1 FtsX-like permease family protein [Algiphilus sp.]
MRSIVAPVRYALRRVRHGWRSRGAWLLVAALAVAVGAAGAVGLFSDRVRAALVAESGEALGADAVLGAPRPIPVALREAAHTAGLRTAAFVTMPTVAFGPDDDSALVSLKAVEDAYPLRSTLQIADRPFAPARSAPPPDAGTAYVDHRLWVELGLFPGARIKVGRLELRVAGALAFEPDRGSGFRDLGPRLMMHSNDLAASGLTGPGARLRYSLQLAGPQPGLEAVAERARAEGIDMQTPAEARRELAAALDRADVFLDLAVVAALLLAAAAAMIAADNFGRSLRDEAALLRVMGASRAFIGRALFSLLLLLGGLGIVSGVLLAWLGQAAIAAIAGSLFGAALPAPGVLPALTAAGLGALLLVGFAMPSVLAVRDVSPMRVFQRAADDRRAAVWLVRGLAVAALVTLIAAQARSLTLTGVVIGGGAVGAVALFVIARLLLRALEGLRRSGAAGAAWRLGLANLARRGRSAGGLAASLGLVLLALLLMAIVRLELLDQWRASLPDGTPNVFLINVQSDQRVALTDFLAQRGYPDIELWPMARGRLVGLNGAAVSAADFDDPETRRWINRDFNLSWSAQLPSDNRLIEGRWWSEEEHNEALLSADDYAVERLALEIGDTLTLRFADRDVTFTVHNLREVEWGSFRPNFFLLAPPKVLADDRVATNWLTSLYVSEQDSGLLRALVERFPNITAIDIDALLAQVRQVIDRVVEAIALLLAFALAAGLLVLLAAIETSRSEREHEVALLRTLGARRRFIARALLVEYGTLGATAGVLASGIAQLVSWQLAQRVFEMPYAPALWPWLLGPVLGALLVGSLGWLALRGVTHVPPDRMLRLHAEG